MLLQRKCFLPTTASSTMPSKEQEEEMTEGQVFLKIGRQGRKEALQE